MHAGQKKRRTTRSQQLDDPTPIEIRRKKGNPKLINICSNIDAIYTITIPLHKILIYRRLRLGIYR